MKKDNIALVLEGGGAKCAYQLGAILALEQKGFSFNVISGASFGALNGALYLSGGSQRLMEFYDNLKIEDILNDTDLCNYTNTYQGDGSDYLQGIIQLMTQKGLLKDQKKFTEYYHNYLFSVIDEDKIKASSKEYYCTVLRINNNPITIGKLLLYFSEHTDILPLYKNREIEGKIIDKNTNELSSYIVASANYPTYAPIEVEGNYYFDGGIYDNIPYRHLLYKGVQDIVIIRTHPEEIDDISLQNPHILVLRPSRNIGHALHINHQRILDLINMGYQETIVKLTNIEIE